ncbi:NAD(P)-binding protein [Cucurbitaria berberidis CBS 394.84]|uniref:NAD(P)-binding protein n=1 Tax=Cucurbitaria berberidis CBS 394.84 TaxID=1168544 RepID=A0A9P4LE31_9PLEO|nr:NAD(P)-binding protein [Cucurbitaria berberidis CBS 394.84]KAF1851423.1 NAD(P)-binding protein [Cucurbitaria berberidis CBS 394.84]
MSHTILITGVSGYLGGSLLTQLTRTNLPPHKRLYALVRSKEQAEAVRRYDSEPLILDLRDEERVTKSIIDAKISIIYFLVDAVKSEHQITMIKALGEVKNQTGQDVHFLHTTGAKMFSQHAGFPTDRKILDTDSKLYELQKSAEPPHEIMAQALSTNNTIIETAKSYRVRSYLFIPCIVYGEGEGFGNRISIQTTAVIKSAKNLRAVYHVNPEGAIWPVCHVRDTTALYVELLRSILSGEDLEYGQNGYYLASSGSVAWADIYSAIAKALARRNVVDSEVVKRADDATLAKMGEALNCPKELVVVQLGGTCTLGTDRAYRVGWEPKCSPEYILDAADAEVELVLRNIKN